MALEIRVKLFFDLQRYGPGGRGDFELELAPGTPVEEVLRGLNLPAGDKVVLINGRQAAPGQTLAAGDLLVVFPPVEGG